MTQQRRNFAWMDLLWLAFLAGLAVLPPRTDMIHKQLILLAIGVFQIFEHRFLEWVPERGRSYSVIMKILFASLLIDHTNGILSHQLLSDLFRARGHGGHVFRSVGLAGMDNVDNGGLLVLRTPGAE